jgi:hypothetical protein
MNVLIDTKQGQLFPRHTAQQILKVHHRRTWRSHLRAVGINPDDNPQLTWSDIKNLLVLQLFLCDLSDGLRNAGYAGMTWDDVGLRLTANPAVRCYGQMVDELLRQLSQGLSNG